MMAEKSIGAGRDLVGNITAGDYRRVGHLTVIDSPLGVG